VDLRRFDKLLFDHLDSIEPAAARPVRQGPYFV
jgi:hypothetical protein